MHSSSSLTLFVKYLFPIIFGTSLLLAIFNAEQTTVELIFPIVLLFLLSVAYVRTFGKLRGVKASNSQLLTETITYEETIPYESILYIYQIALISPTMIGIKYIDEETGERKKFYTLASWSSQLATFNFYGLKDVELVEFVRRKIKSVNPGYDESNEPTKWAPVGYMMLAIVVSIILGNLILAI